MKNAYARLGFVIGFALLVLCCMTPATAGMVKGIYITQSTLENTQLINSIIKGAKAAGVDTFVVDMDIPSKRYRQNIGLLKDNNIQYVARIVMFPGGGTKAQVENPAVWQKKYALVEQAINYGASQIQLDYIRYNTKQGASPEHSKNVLKIIQWYKDKLAAQNIPLQVDVFGISSFGESQYIGQNVKTFSQVADVICPMVYPSHYEPFPIHFATPYKTVYNSLTAIRKQFKDGEKMPAKLVAYIELSNYHYPLSREKKLSYIHEQIKAAQDAGAHGWYAWSPHNKYDALFQVLQTQPVK